jgi:hypothetical protein
VKSKSTILASGSGIIASQCLERQKKKKKEELMIVSKEKNFTERLVQICFVKDRS